MVKTLIIKFLDLFHLGIYKKENANLIHLNDWASLSSSDDNFLRLYKQSLKESGSTNTDNLAKFSRFYLMSQFCEYAIKNSNKSDNFAEIGVFNGHSARIILGLMEQNSLKPDFHLFDSFEGLSEFTANDKKNSTIKGENLRNDLKVHFKAKKEPINALKGIKNIYIHKGWVPSEFYKVENKSFRFVHIDVDLYKPTLESLNFFYPRLVEGGVIVCDDYNSREFPGAKLAWDTFFKENKENYFLSFPFGGCVLIKK